MSSTLLLTTVSESSLTLKMGFLRRYFGIIASEFIFISIISSVIMMSPVARFYISENDWLLVFFAFLLCASYVSLVRLIKEQVIDILLFLHVGIKAGTVAVFATYFDMMCVLQAVVFYTSIIFILFLYTLQSKVNLNIWAIMFISCLGLVFGSSSLNAIFGGSEEENILSILITILLLLYQLCGLIKIVTTLTSDDYVLAVVNLHLLPLNILVFSSAVYKLPR